MEGIPHVFIRSPALPSAGSTIPHVFIRRDRVTKLRQILYNHRRGVYDNKSKMRFLLAALAVQRQPRFHDGSSTDDF